MTSDSGRDQSAALGGTHALALLRSAAASGRAALDDGELSGLLAELGITTATGAAVQDGGAALRIGIERSREFGMVISAGPGGIDAELGSAGSGRQGDGVYAATALAGGDDFLALARRTLAYRRMALRSGPTANAALDQALATCFAALLEIARALGQTSTAQAARALASLSFDATWDGRQLVALDASAALGDLPAARHPRPIEKIDRLLHPRSIGIIGVSAGGMNFGRIILRNLMGSGY
ncbi:MAG: hypothetical protein K0B16_10365, partial [Burkholderiaceae bacterium]|nr:hypothetical protein [Burkholderiaceae bacterium]